MQHQRSQWFKASPSFLGACAQGYTIQGSCSLLYSQDLSPGGAGCPGPDTQGTRLDSSAQGSDGQCSDADSQAGCGQSHESVVAPHHQTSAPDQGQLVATAISLAPGQAKEGQGDANDPDQQLAAAGAVIVPSREMSRLLGGAASTSRSAAQQHGARQHEGLETAATQPPPCSRAESVWPPAPHTLCSAQVPNKAMVMQQQTAALGRKQQQKNMIGQTKANGAAICAYRHIPACSWHGHCHCADCHVMGRCDVNTGHEPSGAFTCYLSSVCTWHGHGRRWLPRVTCGADLPSKKGWYTASLRKRLQLPRGQQENVAGLVLAVVLSALPCAMGHADWMAGRPSHYVARFLVSLVSMMPSLTWLLLASWAHAFYKSGCG
ncbi:hypothetical protein HaLaN_12422 [Haematococcus lacustris]|uniref:Uncharacterized protein n=1 Tax=Haematococcus lacustris TaxID=44745 RepID=A0A699Z0L2_HAELA|nr:hypothetical protein HaLaN_12422 [Haematococcus lacustris]